MAFIEIYAKQLDNLEIYNRNFLTINEDVAKIEDYGSNSFIIIINKFINLLKIIKVNVVHKNLFGQYEVVVQDKNSRLFSKVLGKISGTNERDVSYFDIILNNNKKFFKSNEGKTNDNLFLEIPLYKIEKELGNIAVQLGENIIGPYKFFFKYIVDEYKRLTRPKSNHCTQIEFTTLLNVLKNKYKDKPDVKIPIKNRYNKDSNGNIKFLFNGTVSELITKLDEYVKNLNQLNTNFIIVS